MTEKRDAIASTWSLINSGRIKEALPLSEQFVRDCSAQLDEERNIKSLSILLHACHVAGYAVALSTRNADALVAVPYFSRMQKLAEQLGESDQKGIALSYQGDMYRRSGKYEEAFSYLQTASDLPLSDPAVKGNCALLLGRFFSTQNEDERFAQVMQEALKHTFQIEPTHDSLHGQYGLWTVYLEYARHANKYGNVQDALAYCERAEKLLPKDELWKPYILAVRGEAVIKSGDLETGMISVLEGLNLADCQGNVRLLGAFELLARYLREKSLMYSKTVALLQTALFGTFDL